VVLKGHVCVSGVQEVPLLTDGVEHDLVRHGHADGAAGAEALCKWHESNKRVRVVGWLDGLSTWWVREARFLLCMS